MLGLGCLQRGQDGEGIAAGSQGRARRVSRWGTPSQAETGTAEGGEKKGKTKEEKKIPQAKEQSTAQALPPQQPTQSKRHN